MALDWPIIIAVLSALTAAYAAITSRRKVDAETQATVATSALAFVKTLEEEVARLRADNEKLKAELDAVKARLDLAEARLEEYHSGAVMLCHQIVSLGGKPVWKPKKLKMEDEDA